MWHGNVTGREYSRHIGIYFETRHGSIFATFVKQWCAIVLYYWANRNMQHYVSCCYRIGSDKVTFLQMIIINSSPPNTAYMRQWRMSAFVQILALFRYWLCSDIEQNCCFETIKGPRIFQVANDIMFLKALKIYENIRCLVSVASYQWLVILFQLWFLFICPAYIF